jgi:hypothetical protein
VVIAIAGLHGPAYRYKTHIKQTVKGSYQSFFPGVRQVGQALAGQVRQPMAHAGWGQRRRRPAACCYTESKQDADGFFAAADSAEMGVRTGRHNATTQGTAVALQMQTENKSIKKTRNEAMAPNPEMVAVQTGGRPYPRKILTLLKNVLELNGNKIYHEASFVVWGVTPRRKRAVSSRKLTAQNNLKNLPSN